MKMTWDIVPDLWALGKVRKVAHTLIIIAIQRLPVPDALKVCLMFDIRRRITVKCSTRVLVVFVIVPEINNNGYKTGIIS